MLKGKYYEYRYGALSDVYLEVSYLGVKELCKD